ncbi:MAG TPA: NADPH-dependent oxidoreductase [Halieaceae bacterium]|jgi:NAD(P)H-dependent FMN reductase|nr:NADPH-dependent oxidoreductase [Halieaceae bacterium]
MQIAIIVGSHRKDSQSAKVARFLASQLMSLGEHSCWICDLGKDPLPLWDEEIGSDAPRWSGLKALTEKIDTADAFIMIAPEWHGMVPAALKNFFLVCGGASFAHKPALPVGVSVGPGGTYPINELRTSSYKNNRLCYLPEHLIVRNCMVVMNEDSSENDEGEHSYISERSLYCMKQLIAYADALAKVRASGAADLTPYPNGM